MNFLQFWPRRSARVGLAFVFVFLSGVGIINDSADAQFEAPHALFHMHPLSSTIRWGVLETDLWLRMKDRSVYREVTEFAPPRAFFRNNHLFLLQGAHFTPETYLSRTKEWSLHAGGSDVLFYYGGVRRPGVEAHGLNFNSWSADELRELRAVGGRPFIGLETMDTSAIAAMLAQLESAGYGHGDRLYIRIAAEPSGMSYGVPNGTIRHSEAAFKTYQENFARVATQLRRWGRRRDVRVRIVFTGDSREDFDRYAPPSEFFDDIGYDLYVTPANIRKVLPLLRHVSARFASKPFVIPELGIATGGMSRAVPEWTVRATPPWGKAALGQVLEVVGQHPGGIAQVTVFSVNVAARMMSRTWDWAWTPEMYDELTEWRHDPTTWRLSGFHLYDPETYPLGKDIVLDDRPGLRISYRRLSNQDNQGRPLFLESADFIEDHHERHLERAVVFVGHEVGSPGLPTGMF